MENSGTVLVIGGTGKTGRELVRELAEGGVPVRTASRNPQAVEGGVPAGGVVTARFDWFRTETHGDALTGVERVYLVAPALVADPSEQVAPFVERALGSGVRRIVALSAWTPARRSGSARSSARS